MARITIKQLTKLEDKLREAIRVWTPLDAKASKSLAKKAHNGLDVFAASEAFDSVRAAAIRYVVALTTGHDGKGAHIRVLPAAVFSYSDQLAAGFMERIAEPFAVVFELAEQEAGKDR